MLEKYRKNIELLKQAVETDAVIRPIAKHRKPDGSLDIEGNLLLWNKALEPFEKTRLWEQGTRDLMTEIRCRRNPILYLYRRPMRRNAAERFWLLTAEVLHGELERKGLT